MSFKARQATIKLLLTCGICRKICKECTTIDECCHTFCSKCIRRKITEENLRKCPECNTDLGCTPLQRLKLDYRWQSVRNKYVGIKRLLAREKLMKARAKKAVALEPNNNQLSDHKPPVDKGAAPESRVPADRKGKEKLHQPPIDESILEAGDDDHEFSVELPLPSRIRKEKSISSLVGTGNNETPNWPTAPPPRQKRKYTRRKPVLPRKASLPSTNLIEVANKYSLVISSNLNPSTSFEPSREQVAAQKSQEQAAELIGRSRPEPLAEAETKPRRRRRSAVATAAKTSSVPVSETSKAAEPINAVAGSANHESNAVLGSSSASIVATVPKMTRKGRPRKEGKNNGLAVDLNIPTQIVVDASSVRGRTRDVWFQLVGCKKQESSGILPPLPPKCIRVKDVNQPARLIKKLVVIKLGLPREDENKVEISMQGQPIHPEVRMYQLIEMWSKTLAKPEMKKTVVVGSSAQDFLMVITYSMQLQN